MNYKTYTKLSERLLKLIAEDKDDSNEANDLRDEMDDVWNSLTEDEQRRARKRVDKIIRAVELAKANPLLSIRKIAEHVGSSEQTISKWFDKLGMKKWKE